MAVEATPRQALAGRLDDAGLAADRLIDVNDGEKGSDVRHADPSNRHAPEDVNGNSGVYAGGGLIILDVDDYAAGDDATARVDELPPTLTAETPHTDGEAGGHRYYRVAPGDEYDSARGACEAVWGKPNPSPSWGELRVHNQYVVGPGSALTDCKHGCCTPGDPGGYEIANDRPIVTITADELADVLRADPEYEPPSTNSETEAATTSTTAPTPAVEYDADAAAVMEQAIREFQANMETTPRAFENVMGLARGDYAEWGHEGDRSGAELNLVSYLFGILRFTGDGENASQRIYSYISEACEDQPTANGRERRKWIERGEDYRHETIEAAIGTFNQEWWDRWRLSKEEPYQHTGDYGEPMYRYVLWAVRSTFEERPGYPSKDDVLNAAQGMNPERARRSHEEVLRRLRTEREQVKLARWGRNYVYYPASEPDPPNAKYYQIGGEKHYLR